MNETYKLIHIYVDKLGNLLIIPTGKSQKYFGAIKELSIVNQLNKPFLENDLYIELVKTLDQCFSEEPDDTTNLSALEKFLDIKGYSKATKNRKLIILQWNNKEGYYITPTKKVPREGFTHLEDKTIMLGDSLECNGLLSAVTKAIELSE